MPRVSPGDYLPNHREAALAEAVWEIGEQKRRDAGYSLHPTLRPQAMLTWVNQRLVYSRNWITLARSNGTLNGVLRTNYSGEEIGNVQHFFVAAANGQLGGPILGPAMGVHASAIWDLGVSPASKIRNSLRRRKGMPWEGLKYDLRQFTFYDIQGARFGWALLPEPLSERVFP